MVNDLELALEEEEMIGLMVEETLKLLNYSGEAGRTEILTERFLSRFVGAVTFSALSLPAEEGWSKQEHLEETESAFRVVKSLVASAVASGVGSAVKMFSGRALDYYCILAPTPKPVNKQPC